MVQDLIKQLYSAIGESIDWDAIRGIKMTLDGYADTAQKRQAVRRLAEASTATEVQLAASGLSVAFAGPFLYDEKGYPRNNPNFQPPSKAKRKR